MQKILLYGTVDIVQKVARLFGNKKSSARNALIYYEFPNKNITDESITNMFPNKIKVYQLQSALLNSIIIPSKREFNEANLILWIFDWIDPKSIQEGYEYFKKLMLSRKSFLPIFLLAYRETKNVNYKDNEKNGEIILKDSTPIHTSEEIENCEDLEENYGIQFLQLLEFRNYLEQFLDMPVYYYELDLSRSQASYNFMKMLKDYLFILTEKFGKSYRLEKFSTIAVEQILKDVEEIMEQNILRYNNEETSESEVNYDELIKNIAYLENDSSFPITRHYLIEEFGCVPQIARNIINYWEKRAPIKTFSEDFKEGIIKYSDDLLKYCIQKEIQPNYYDLVKNGYKLSLIQPILYYLHQQDKISSISAHIISENFWEFENIQEVIIRHEGRVLYVKSHDNIDKTLMFSDMIYTLESIRNEYLLKMEKENLKEKNRIEFLEFGNLRALIGYGQKGVKLNLRLNKPARNKQKLRKRCLEFLSYYEDQIDLTPAKEHQVQKIIKEQSAQIYLKFFNPFPTKIDVFKEISLSPDISKDTTNILTNTERLICSVLHECGKLTIEKLTRVVFERTKATYSRSDIIPYILDLLKEKILI